MTKEGIITFPYKYQNTKDEIQLNLLSPVLSQAKLLVLDWNLEDAKSGSNLIPGTASLKILNNYMVNRKGLKCAVIYTQTNCKDVLDEIGKHFDIVDEEAFFFKNVGERMGILYSVLS